MDNPNKPDIFTSYANSLFRKLERVEDKLDWMKEKMEKDEKHIIQIYKNKEEIQQVKTIGTVLFALIAFVGSLFGLKLK